MITVTVEALIDATPDAVFHALSDIENFPSTNPATQSVAFLGEQQQGIGTRFREVRLMNGQEMAFDLEVAGYDAEARTTRFVNETHGTVWDTTVTVTPEVGGARARFAMDCIGSTLLKRLMNRVMSPLFRRGMQDQVDALKRYCEAP